MSWADDIRCLYCDGRLPLYRKITNGQFCSAAHRKAYWVEQERLAVERLHQTHDSLRAYRPVAGYVEEILGPAAEPLGGETEMEAVPVFETPQTEERPEWMPAVNAGEVPVAGFVKGPEPQHPRWIEDRLVGGELELMELRNPVRHPVNVYATSDCVFEFASVVYPEIRVAAVEANIETALVPMDVVQYPVTRLALDAAPLTPELREPQEEDPAPLHEGLCSLSQPSLVDCPPMATELAPLGHVMRAQLPLDAIRLNATLSPAALLQAGLREIPVDRITLVPGPWVDSLRAVEFKGEIPQFVLSTPPLRPRLHLATGRRYQVEGRDPVSAIAVVDTSSLAARPPSISLPQRSAEIERPEPVQFQQPEPVFEPNPAGLVPLACTAEPSESAVAIRPVPAALTLPQPLQSEPLRPSSNLEPLDAKPVSDHIADAAPEIPIPAWVAPAIPAPTMAPPPEVEKPHIWTHAIDFWNRAPRDLKMLVFAIPVLLGLALHPSLPKVRVAAPAAATGLQKNVKNVVNQQLGGFRKTMLERAAIALDEDFRGGLDEWVSRGDATTEWSFDATGFVRPGPLAMYRPSMGLTDYQMQFLGMLDKKSLSWVVRAVDFDNYYVVKLVVLKAGPVPTIGVTRYAVINGKADSRADTMVPVDAREDMLYRVRLDVHGDDFALSVQGQMVDSWSEARLSHGGIGFFAAPGEESRLRWVQVTHQYDMLGRLCAYLAPYNVASANGSFQQQ